MARPTLQELMAAFQDRTPEFDPSKISQAAIQGTDLAATVLARKQAQEDRVRALAEKIDQVKRQRALSQAVKSQVSPVAGLAADVDPNQASRQILEKEFTERAAKAPKTPAYSKIGETPDEIILADLTDPSKQFRVKAPGVGSKGGRGDSALALQTEKDRAKVIINKAKDALGKVGPLTTGMGSAIADIPLVGRGSQAKDLASTVDTIKANLGFEQLAKMRQASPTGGALGQIAVRELEFLQAAVANLNPDQSEPQVRANLNEVITRYQNWLDAVEGREPGNGGQTPPAGNPGSSGLSPEQRRARIAELKAKQAAGTLR